MCEKMTPGESCLRIAIFAIALSWSSLIQAQNPIMVQFNCQQVAVGDQICVPITVENFQNIASVTLLITWDPQVLEFVGIQNDVYELNGSAWFDPGPNDLRYIWVDPNITGQALPDGSTLFEVCFIAIGPPGSSSVVTVAPFVLNPNNTTEFGNPDAEVVPFVVEPCTVEIINPPTVLALLDACGSPDGIANGSFTITGAGGTPPYTYTWVGPVNGNSNLPGAGSSETQSVPPGSYTITIMDNTGQSQVSMITIAASDLEPVITIIRDISCYTFSNGRIEVGAFASAYPLSVIWRNLLNPPYNGSGYIPTPSDVYLLNSLPVGEYEILLIDANGCQKVDTISLSASPILIDAMTSNATCVGQMDGSVQISFSGGSPYLGGIYEVTPGWGGGTSMTTSPIMSPAILGPGDYWVEICDSINNCCVRDTFTIGANTVISADIAAEPPTCPGQNDGEVRLEGLTNGANMGNYGFVLLDGNKNVAQGPINGASAVTFSMLSPGNYFAVVVQGPCASDTIAFTIPVRDPIVINVLQIVASGCIQGQNSGEILVEAVGGEPGYNYVWDGGAHMGAHVTGLPSGNHFLTVTDNNGCTQVRTIMVPQAVGPMIEEIVATNVGCGGGNVTLEVIFTEGTAPVSDIIWSTGDTTAIIDSVAAGMVNVTIRDSLFCFDIANFMVPDAPVMVIDSLVVEPPTCAGDADGQIAVFVSEGIPPYQFIWSTGDTTAFNLLAGLTAGDYSVTILGSDTCNLVIDTMLTLMDPVAPVFVFDPVDATTCSETCDGQATLIPSGGIAGLPFTFIWEAGLMESGMQSTATGLCPGIQVVSITQDDLCYYVDSVFIPSPAPIAFDTLNVTGPTCHGGADGEIAIQGNGGTGPYTYAWSIPGAGSTQSNLMAGSYQVTITDFEGCMGTFDFVLNDADSLSVVIDSAQLRPISCTFANSGSIAVQVEGGTGDYTFTWSPDVSSSFIANNLGPGLYAITVTDAAGCTDTTSVELTGPDPVSGFLAPVDDPLCFGALTPVTVDSASGGNGGYSWSVNGGEPHALDSLVFLPAGIYNIITQDSTGCRDTVQIFIDNPDPIEAEVIPAEAVIDLGDSIQLHVSIIGTPGLPDSIIWVPNDDLTCADCADPFASNTLPTLYTVTVWDENGCSATVQVLVDVDNRREVFIPNAFSPNFDGRNDDLRVFTGRGITAIPAVRIFDRWGETVYQLYDVMPDAGGAVIWDGTYLNKMMLPGVYVYVVEVAFADGQTLTYHGDVTLVR